MKKISRRDFIKALAVGGAALKMGYPGSCGALQDAAGHSGIESQPVVSVVKIINDNIDYAVRQAVDLLGGIKTLSAGKKRIMLKPNLVKPEPRDVTKPAVIRALAQLMLEAEKDVSIG